MNITKVTYWLNNSQGLRGAGLALTDESKEKTVNVCFTESGGLDTDLYVQQHLVRQALHKLVYDYPYLIEDFYMPHLRNALLKACVYENEVFIPSVDIRTSVVYKIHDDERIKPWHHVMCIAGTSKAIVYVWDTRVIEAVIDVPVLSMPAHNVVTNDSRKFMYCHDKDVQKQLQNATIAIINKKQ